MIRLPLEFIRLDDDSQPHHRIPDLNSPSDLIFHLAQRYLDWRGMHTSGPGLTVAFNSLTVLQPAYEHQVKPKWTVESSSEWRPMHLQDLKRPVKPDIIEIPLWVNVSYYRGLIAFISIYCSTRRSCSTVQSIDRSYGRRYVNLYCLWYWAWKHNDNNCATACKLHFTSLHFTAPPRPHLSLTQWFLNHHMHCYSWLGTLSMTQIAKKWPVHVLFVNINTALTAEARIFGFSSLL